jgi:hypothetical protein
MYKVGTARRVNSAERTTMPVQRARPGSGNDGNDSDEVTAGVEAVD